MRLTEFLELLDDKIDLCDPLLSTMDVEVDIQELDGSDGFVLVLSPVDPGTDSGRIRF